MSKVEIGSNIAGFNGWSFASLPPVAAKLLLNSVYGVGNSFSLPDKVIFNEEKGKTTLLFANGNGGYNASSSKTDGKDRFDKMFGFYMAYFKYLHADKNNEAFIEHMYKEASGFNRLRYLKGAVDVFVSDLVEFHAMADDVITKDVWVREEYEAQVKKEKNRIRKEASLKLKIEEKEAELSRLKGKLK